MSNKSTHEAPQPLKNNQAFSSLPLSPLLLSNLDLLGYESMTAIQAETLPLMIKGEDIIAKAKTGSGKTAAFGLTILNNLQLQNFAAQALVLCPTRELAEQVSQTLRRLARLMPNVKIINLSGGIPMRPQVDSLRHGGHIIVGTPGRLQKHIDRGSLILDNLQTIVLDEGDRMLDMGFLDAIKSILAVCPNSRQSLLFSATYPPEIKKLCDEFMRNPKEVHIDTVHDEQNIEQHYYEVTNHNEKFSLLKTLLLHYNSSSTLIFCNTKQQTSQLAAMLNKEGFSACALNGDMEQIERDLVMIRFSNQSCSILVATDVAARGLDIKELPAVINFELAFESDVHIHRIGRTGRAGSKGLAFSLTLPADAQRIAAIEDDLGHPVTWKESKELGQTNRTILKPEMVTLCLDAGRKEKIRPGDILGALTKEAQLPFEGIGKINITDLHSYIAVHKNHVDKAVRHFQSGKLKGRRVNVKKV